MPFFKAVWRIKRTCAAVEKKVIGVPVKLNAPFVELNAPDSWGGCI